jgi:hypothetical protein
MFPYFLYRLPETLVPTGTQLYISPLPIGLCGGIKEQKKYPLLLTPIQVIEPSL